MASPSARDAPAQNPNDDGEVGVADGGVRVDGGRHERRRDERDAEASAGDEVVGAVAVDLAGDDDADEDDGEDGESDSGDDHGGSEGTADGSGGFDGTGRQSFCRPTGSLTTRPVSGPMRARNACVKSATAAPAYARARRGPPAEPDLGVVPERCPARRRRAVAGRASDRERDRDRAGERDLGGGAADQPQDAVGDRVLHGGDVEVRGVPAAQDHRLDEPEDQRAAVVGTVVGRRRELAVPGPQARRAARGTRRTAPRPPRGARRARPG